MASIPEERSSPSPGLHPALEKKAERPWLAWFALFAFALIIYGASASAQIQWHDSGQFDLDTLTGKMDVDFGLCTAHPLHFWLSILFTRALPVSAPLGCAWVSAFGGAIAVANVFGIVRTLTKDARAALLAAVGLMVAHSFWRFSCFAEVYSITAALLTLEFWAVVKWDQTRNPEWMVLCFLANGVGFSNHNLALLTLPVIGVIFLIAVFRREIWVCTALLSAAAWFGGSAIYLTMIVQDALHTTWREAIRSALVGHWSGEVAGGHFTLMWSALSIAFTLLSFPNLMLPAIVLGVLRGRSAFAKPMAYWALIAAVLMHLGFVVRYNVIDQYTFLVPIYALMAVLAGAGFAHVRKTWSPSKRRSALTLATLSVIITPAIYPVVLGATRHFHALGHYVRNKPYRDDYHYLFIPWARGENSAELMSTAALAKAGADGLIIAQDLMGSWAIEYQLLMAHRNGVEVLDEKEGAAALPRYAAKRKPVVFVPYSVDVPPPTPAIGTWKRDGQLFVLDVPPASR